MLQQERANMFTEIEQTAAGYAVIFDVTVDIFPYLMGGAIPNVTDELMIQIWKVAGRNIHNMYKLVLERNEGIG